MEKYSSTMIYKNKGDVNVLYCSQLLRNNIYEPDMKIMGRVIELRMRRCNHIIEN